MPLEVDFLLLAPTCPRSQPLVLCCCALAPLDGWELGFLTAFNCQPVLPDAPACSEISPSLFLPTSWCQARGNPTGKDSTGLIKPWGYSQWLVQTEAWAMAEML